MTVTAVIPTHDASEHLASTVLTLLALDDPNLSRVILVDDGSTDGTWSVIEELAADDRVGGVRLSNNQGQYMATVVGLANVDTPYALTLDDDVLLDDEQFAQLSDPVVGGSADLVYGPWRTDTRSSAALIRSVGIRVAGRAVNWKEAPEVSSLRCFRLSLIGDDIDAMSAQRGVQLDIELTRRAEVIRSTRFRKHRANPLARSRYSLRRRLSDVRQYARALLVPKRYRRDDRVDPRSLTLSYCGWLQDRRPHDPDGTQHS